MRDLGRGIIKLLDENTEHGFVFRVDMRLRPWGWLTAGDAYGGIG